MTHQDETYGIKISYILLFTLFFIITAAPYTYFASAAELPTLSEDLIASRDDWQAIMTANANLLALPPDWDVMIHDEPVVKYKEGNVVFNVQQSLMARPQDLSFDSEVILQVFSMWNTNAAGKELPIPQKLLDSVDNDIVPGLIGNHFGNVTKLGKGVIRTSLADIDAVAYSARSPRGNDVRYKCISLFNDKKLVLVLLKCMFEHETYWQGRFEPIIDEWVTSLTLTPSPKALAVSLPEQGIDVKLPFLLKKDENVAVPAHPASEDAAVLITPTQVASDAVAPVADSDENTTAAEVTVEKTASYARYALWALALVVLLMLARIIVVQVKRRQRKRSWNMQDIVLYPMVPGEKDTAAEVSTDVPDEEQPQEPVAVEQPDSGEEPQLSAPGGTGGAVALPSEEKKLLIERDIILSGLTDGEAELVFPEDDESTYPPKELAFDVSNKKSVRAVNDVKEQKDPSEAAEHVERQQICSADVSPAAVESASEGAVAPVTVTKEVVRPRSDVSAGEKEDVILQPLILPEPKPVVIEQAVAKPEPEPEQPALDDVETSTAGTDDGPAAVPAHGLWHLLHRLFHRSPHGAEEETTDELSSVQDDDTRSDHSDMVAAAASLAPSDDSSHRESAVHTVESDLEQERGFDKVYTLINQALHNIDSKKLSWTNDNDNDNEIVEPSANPPVAGKVAAAPVEQMEREEGLTSAISPVEPDKKGSEDIHVVERDETPAFIDSAEERQAEEEDVKTQRADDALPKQNDDATEGVMEDTVQYEVNEIDSDDLVSEMSSYSYILKGLYISAFVLVILADIVIRVLFSSPMSEDITFSQLGVLLLDSIKDNFAFMAPLCLLSILTRFVVLRRPVSPGLFQFLFSVLFVAAGAAGYAIVSLHLFSVMPEITFMRGLALTLSWYLSYYTLSYGAEPIDDDIDVPEDVDLHELDDFDDDDTYFYEEEPQPEFSGPTEADVPPSGKDELPAVKTTPVPVQEQKEQSLPAAENSRPQYRASSAGESRHADAQSAAVQLPAGSTPILVNEQLVHKVPLTLEGQQPASAASMMNAAGAQPAVVAARAPVQNQSPILVREQLVSQMPKAVERPSQQPVTALAVTGAPQEPAESTGDNMDVQHQRAIELSIYYLNKVFKELEANLGSSFVMETVKNEVSKTMENENGMLHILQNNEIPPEGIIFRLCNSIIIKLIQSGRYHIEMGILSNEGQDLVDLFNYINAQALKKSYLTLQEAQKDAGFMRRCVSELGY